MILRKTLKLFHKKGITKSKIVYIFRGHFCAGIILNYQLSIVNCQLYRGEMKNCCRANALLKTNGSR